jgi:hypothetical protein
MDIHQRDDLESLIWDWLDDTLPAAQDGRTSRIALGGVECELGVDHVTFDRNLCLYYRGDRFDHVVAVRYMRVLIVNAEAIPLVCQPPKDSGYQLYLRDAKTLSRLYANITFLRSNPSKRAGKKFREALGDLADTFPEPHKSNKLITKYRIRNALNHEGLKRAVTYEKPAKDDGEVFGLTYWDSIEDAVHARLSNPQISNVLEL